MTCDNSTILRLILLVKQVIDIISIVVPVLLVLMSMLDIVKLIVSGMDKTSATLKKVGNRIVAAIIFFLVPTIVNIVLSVMNVGDFMQSDCWVNANKEFIAQLKLAEENTAQPEDMKKTANKKAKEEWDAEQLKKRKELNLVRSQINNSDGSILLIAGHGGPDPGATYGSYREHDLAVEVVVGVQAALQKMGVDSVIANKVLADDMNVDILYQKTTLASTIDLSKFSRVLEIHFNAGGGMGAEVYVTDIGNPSPFDQALMTNTEGILGRHGSGFLDSTRVSHLGNVPLGNYTFFHGTQNLAYSLYEVAFVDNAASINKYVNNKEKLYDAIAKTLKENG